MRRPSARYERSPHRVERQRDRGVRRLLSWRRESDHPPLFGLPLRVESAMSRIARTRNHLLGIRVGCSRSRRRRSETRRGAGFRNAQLSCKGAFWSRLRFRSPTATATAPANPSSSSIPIPMAGEALRFSTWNAPDRTGASARTARPSTRTFHAHRLRAASRTSTRKCFRLRWRKDRLSPWDERRVASSRRRRC